MDPPATLTAQSYNNQVQSFFKDSYNPHNTCIMHLLTWADAATDFKPPAMVTWTWTNVLSSMRSGWVQEEMPIPPVCWGRFDTGAVPLQRPPQSTTPTSKCIDFNIQHSALVSATRTRLQYFVAILKSSPRAIECNNAKFYEAIRTSYIAMVFDVFTGPMTHLFEI